MHRVGQGEQEFLLGRLVFVEDEMVEPTGRQYRYERFLDRGPRALDRRLEGVELAVDRIGPLRFERTAGDDAFSHRWHRRFAGDQKQRPSPVAIAIKIRKFVARSEEHTSELQSHLNLVCRLLLEKKNITYHLHKRYNQTFFLFTF